MKKNYKKGFFLSETMVVMAIVTIVIVAIFKIFSTTYVKYKESENYNTVNAVNALANVKKYFESFGEMDADALLNGNAYIDLTNYDTYNNNYYESIKEEYSIDSVYIINMSTINSSLNNLDMTFRKYVKSLKPSNDKLLVVNVEGNKYASASLIKELPTLIGNADDEYITYVNKGDAFVDPGYSNWSGTPPTTTWQDNKELNTNIVGNYYLIYNFNDYLIRRKIVVVELSKNFEFTGEIQTFTVPLSGYYKLEIWGGSGGLGMVNGALIYDGGFGGYSVGTKFLNAKEKLYIYVGGRGIDPPLLNLCVGSAGGFNGGGNGGTDNNCAATQNEPGGGGGGATHIATEHGLLSELELSKSSIIIVAGGGGAGGYNGAGGSGGGFQGYYGNKATTIVGTQYSGFSFGIGGDGKINNAGGGGGGGGYFSGGGGVVSGDSGGGGSGYIANPSLTNKYMYCKGCSESNDENTFTVNTVGDGDLIDTVNCPEGYSINPISKCAKSGNGYAKINYLGSSLQ